MQSLPAFDPARVGGLYLFYKPIVYLNQNDKTLYQGLVRMLVDTTTITRQIADSRRVLIQSTAVIALLAIALGILGAVIMASITITPIRKLAQGVTFIGATEDKEELKEYSIAVRSRDEIGQLADTVNDMTRGLVKAAIANKELMVGKDIQKMFLPLEKDKENRKGTTGGEETNAVEIYGYYEGAKGVSGDYFDFRKLDESHYALIKCDVAGKGVSAALIMVEVATLFASFSRDWQKRREAVTPIKDPAAKQKAMKELERIDQLVYTINDSLEERGFKGRFAALTMCLFNADTGMLNVCNAGDTLMHLYDAGRRRMEIEKLPDAPAAGVFPSMLVEMKSGFRQVPHRLEHGDALFLFTDGFEEAKHNFRNASWEVVPCGEPGLKDGELHMGTHSTDSSNEEFGAARMEGIVNAVFSKGRYTLVRAHSPDASEELVFDFSSCTGTVKEAVLALVSVEKVFRVVPDPKAGEKDHVNVDALVETFLKGHFLQYNRYFAHRPEGQNGTASVTFTHIREDEQYDDLTILVMRRK